MNSSPSRASWIDVAIQRKAEEERQQRERSKTARRNRYERLACARNPGQGAR